MEAPSLVIGSGSGEAACETRYRIGASGVVTRLRWAIPPG